MAEDPVPADLRARPADWHLRPWILAALLALAGLAIHFLTAGEGGDVPWRVAAAAFIAFAALAFAFTVDRGDWRAPAIFAAVVGLVIGGLAFHAIEMEERLAGEEYALAAGIFASVLAVPLFQAGFHRLRFATPYREAYFHVWTDVFSAGGALLFTGLSWLMLLLLNALLDLVGLGFIEDLIEEGWFAWMWSAGAFGAALGILRNQVWIIGTLQSVVLLVLSLLAVPLAAALIVFLIALVLSGGQALWDATDSATPILLAAAAGCFVLACAIVREDDEAISGNIVLRLAALVLAAGIFPLAGFAAISTGIRIDQYGLAPERIWALCAVAVATAYGLAYWVALARGRGAAWRDRLRGANLNLAFGTLVFALFLALPIFDFGAISARNQVARLQAGEVSPERFDYAALRWDFGEAGRKALDRLATDGSAEVRKLAAAAQAQTERVWDMPRFETGELDQTKSRLRLAGVDEEARVAMLALVDRGGVYCHRICTLVDTGRDEDGLRRFVLVQGAALEPLAIDEQGLMMRARDISLEPPERADFPGPEEEVEVEVREWSGRRIYVDGIPVGQPFE